jgi:hypothetical protein
MIKICSSFFLSLKQSQFKKKKRTTIETNQFKNKPLKHSQSKETKHGNKHISITNL